MNALCRYLGRRKCAQSVSLQPPFLRPQLTEAQLAAKILDNGIQGDLHRVRGAAKVLVKLTCHKLCCAGCFSLPVINKGYARELCFSFKSAHDKFAYRQVQMAARALKAV